MLFRAPPCAGLGWARLSYCADPVNVILNDRTRGKRPPGWRVFLTGSGSISRRLIIRNQAAPADAPLSCRQDSRASYGVSLLRHARSMVLQVFLTWHLVSVML